MSLPVYSARVVKNPYVASETRGLRLQVSDPHFSFSAGQFVNIIIPHAGEGKKVLRAYSVASSPAVLPELELCVKIVEGGLGTGYINSLTEGDEVFFHGPFGHFGPKNNEKKKLLVATGTGIAPMKAIVDNAKDSHFKTPYHLVFGVREEVFAAYKKDFESTSESYENCMFHLYVSRPPENFDGHTGRVTAFIAEQPAEFFEHTEVLICGSPVMVKEVKKILLEEKGMQKEDIIVEAY